VPLPYRSRVKPQNSRHPALGGPRCRIFFRSLTSAPSSDYLPGRSFLALAQIDLFSSGDDASRHVPGLSPRSGRSPPFAPRRSHRSQSALPAPKESQKPVPPLRSLSEEFFFDPVDHLLSHLTRPSEERPVYEDAVFTAHAGVIFPFPHCEVSGLGM